MTSIAWASQRRWPAWAAIGLAAVCGLSFIWPTFAQGWLVAFIVASSVPVGCLVLLLIHRLTGGEWGDAISPALRRAAEPMPLVALSFAPVMFGAGAIYPWAEPGSAAAPGVEAHYLNMPFFVARAVLALGGWSILASLVVRGRCTRLAAGLGLSFYGLTISLVAVDWVLSVDPRFVSTAFPALFAIQQMLAALAFAALAAPEVTVSRGAGDLGAFLIAALLGTVYLGYTSYVVSWYGDLPGKAEWYLGRSAGAWGWTIGTAFLGGALLPFVLLLSHGLRRDRKTLRAVGALILAGVTLHCVWLVAPAFDPVSLVVAAAALGGLAVLSVVLARDFTPAENEEGGHGE